MKLLAWARTDTGKRRDHNEDSHLALPKVGLFAVADGMGGHQAGERASRLAVDVVAREVELARADFEAASGRLLDEARSRWMELLADDGGDETQKNHLEDDTREIPEQLEAPVSRPVSSVIRLAAHKASASVFAASKEDSTLRGMGTTLTALLFEGGRGYLVHVGDSRAYLLRDGKLRQLTDDHSWIAEQVRAGIMSEAEAQESRYRHVITRSIGFEQNVDLDSEEVVVQAGDCYLLCTDGLSNYIDNDELQELMRDQFYRRLPDALIDLANARGGDDNITAIVVYVANSA